MTEAGEGEDPPTTRRGFLGLDCIGEGVLGLGLGFREGLGFGLRMGLTGFLLDETEDEEEVNLEKKEVIWLCWLTIGDRPLL